MRWQRESRYFFRTRIVEEVLDWVICYTRYVCSRVVCFYALLAWPCFYGIHVARVGAHPRGSLCLYFFHTVFADSTGRAWLYGQGCWFEAIFAVHYRASVKWGPWGTYFYRHFCLCIFYYGEKLLCLYDILG